MGFSTGSLTVCGNELPSRSGQVRAMVAIARAGGVVELEPWLRVRDHLIEHGGPDRDERFDKACQRLGLAVERESLVGELDAARVTLLSVALALLDESRVVLVDDLDRGLPGAEQSMMWERMRALTEDGTTVLAVTTDREPLDGRADVVVDLEAGMS
jgi:ABC-type multidrug transport system ATPase subunit